jgi:hypothetical protein
MPELNGEYRLRVRLPVTNGEEMEITSGIFSVTPN